MFGMGPWELLLVFLAVLLLFGARRLPEIAAGLGKGIKEFKKAVKDTSSELKSAVDTDVDSKPAPKPPSEQRPDDQQQSG